MSIDSFIAEFVTEVERENRMVAVAHRASARIKARDSAPGFVATGKSAFDAVWAQAKPLYRCPDGAFRTEKQIRRWQADGQDAVSRMRRKLQGQHCGGQCHARPGHLCSCGH